MGWGEVAGGVATGGLSYFGQVAANRTNAQIARDANESSERQSKEQMAFQERMANTAHQREVEDLRKAGINPILSRNAGAPAPAGAMGDVKTAHMENALDKGVTSAIGGAVAKMALRKQENELGLIQAQKMAQEASANRDNTTAKATAVNTKIQELMAPGQILESTARGSQSKYYLDNKQFLDTNNMIREGLGTVNSAKGAALDWSPKFSPKTPDWVGTGKDGTQYHKKTGEIIRQKRK